MLYPQTNSYRQCADLSGLWEIQFDPGNVGGKTWVNGLPSPRPIAVPASWNEQLADARDNLGPAWYQTRFGLPWGWRGQQIRLRFGSVNYLAEVWLNGEWLGCHEGGHLPFEFDVTARVRDENNLLIVRVDGKLAIDRVPPGNVPLDPQNSFGVARHPATNFDFFPYCGIHRPVVLYAVPPRGIDDVTVVTQIEGTTGIVRARVPKPDDAILRATLRGQHHTPITAETSRDEIALTIPHARLWSPAAPYLYDLTIELARAGVVYDRYTLPVGIRTIRVSGAALLLNDEPIVLRGFGRHEDFPIIGRGVLPAVTIKDYELMRWVGANSFRTSHYPYSEQMLDLADRLGFLVIDETPAVGLFFADEGLDKRFALCQQYVREMIARDKNHPSVIAWSLANEPHARHPAAAPFFRALYDAAKSLDATRPITLASHLDGNDQSFAFLDLLCLNRYNGWKSETAQLDWGCEVLTRELDEVYARYHKPIILTEFGAEALPGCHAEPPAMFSEEYQAETIARIIQVLNSKPYVVGQHVWCLCDFKTSQEVRRMGSINHKGVFTRERQPKLAAHRLRQLWSKNESS
jgi:beta-glucuronidase